MATVTIDPRPTVLGNLMMVTGSFTADGTSQTVSLGDHLATIDSFTIMPVKASVVATPIVTIDTDPVTDILLTVVNTEDYRFMALGQRS
tara:strand:- start:428 stop:694 length:267 start_codon:yes stop_codon:yes gene_type:complete